MTILDRYILRTFLFNFICWNICFIGIFVVFDLFTNFDALSSAGKAAGNLPKVLFLYYFFKSLPLTLLLGSALMLGSAMVTAAVLIRNNEIIPIQAAGVPTLRIIQPLIWSVICVSAAFFLMQEFVLPAVQDRITMTPADYAEDKGTLFNVTLDNETGTRILGQRVFRRERRISEPDFNLSSPAVKQPVRILAENGYQQPATKQHPAGYLLTDVRNKEITKSPSVMFDGKPILITPPDAPDWLKPDQCFVVSNVPFESLASVDAWKYASVLTLLSAANNKSLDAGTSIHATIHSRLIQPFLDITLFFLAFPLLFYGNKNVFKSMGQICLILFGFMLVCYTCRFIGINYNMPVLGSWLPLIIFTPFAVNQYFQLKQI
ncbi:MAG: LptF/LptG family permease [Planctomycetaceae bacterium]|jgi:lipopolysaccharide export system permease protein|nr:LptF/LptG family permease [Planctomycetaceae bacterium]